MRVYARTARVPLADDTARVRAAALAVAGLALASIIGVVLTPSPAAAATSLQEWAGTSHTTSSTVTVHAGDKNKQLTLGVSTTSALTGTVPVTLTIDTSHLAPSIQVSASGCSGSPLTCSLSLSPGHTSDQTTLRYTVSATISTGSRPYLTYSASDTSGDKSGTGRVTFQAGSSGTIKGSLSSAKVGGTTTASATVGGLQFGGFGSTVTIAESDSAHALQAASGNGCSTQGNTFTCSVQRGGGTVKATFKVLSCGVKGSTTSSITVLFTLKSGGGGFGGGSSTVGTATATLHPTGCAVAPSPTPSALPSLPPTPTDGPTNIVSTGAIIVAPTQTGEPVNAADVTTAGANPVLVGIAIVAVLAGIVAVGAVGLRIRRPLPAGGADFEATGAYPAPGYAGPDDAGRGYDTSGYAAGGYAGDETREYTAVDRDDQPDPDA